MAVSTMSRDYAPVEQRALAPESVEQLVYDGVVAVHNVNVVITRQRSVRRTAGR